MKKIRIRYFVILFFLLILIFNEGNRAFVRRCFEVSGLKKNIAQSLCQNELLKRRIYYLENEPSYLEKIVRDELNVAAQDEIEYRF